MVIRVQHFFLFFPSNVFPFPWLWTTDSLQFRFGGVCHTVQKMDAEWQALASPRACEAVGRWNVTMVTVHTERCVTGGTWLIVGLSFPQRRLLAQCLYLMVGPPASLYPLSFMFDPSRDQPCFFVLFFWLSLNRISSSLCVLNGM